MQDSNTTASGLLFESSWEVCHKVGGIYTVLSTKAHELTKQYGDRLIFIGPDLWTKENPSPDFMENKSLLQKATTLKLPFDIKLRVGRWDIPGSPIVVLVDYKGVTPHINEIYGQMWNQYGVDSLHAYGDYEESCCFAVACAVTVKALTNHLGYDPMDVVAHFDEWTTGMGLLYLKSTMPDAATVFTTHATSIGRSICSNGKDLYAYFSGYDGDQMARELNMEAKHSLEKTAAREADCFTTVSEVTARECTQLLGVTPQVVTPNGFEPDFVGDGRKLGGLRRAGRNKLVKIANLLTGKGFDVKDTFIVATSGRNEYRNKGIDLYLDSMAFLGEYCKDEPKKILALTLVPAWVKEPSQELLTALDGTRDKGQATDRVEPDYITHRLNNEDTDAIACRIRQLENETRGLNVTYIDIPCYLDGHDGIVNIGYYDLLPALDATVFASYYEPWGYTPLESVAFGVPTVTTDKAGFGQWALSEQCTSLLADGVQVVERDDSSYELSKQEIAGALRTLLIAKPAAVKKAREAAQKLAEKADWKYFIAHYDHAYDVARQNRDRRIK